MTDHIVWFDRYEPKHKPFVGGKNSSLGEMMRAELPVPPGFAITTNAYGLIWSDKALVDDINGLLRSIDHDDLAGNREISNKIRNRIEQSPVPDGVVADIAEAYAALCRHCEVDDVPVAVRSSATAEDLPDASFAGQQDTYLWIRGAGNIVEHVKRCWSSLFTDRAIAYRHSMGYLHEAIAMSVGVQKMVDPIASGVAFTLNPTNGDRSQVAVDASWGLGEAVVSGEVTPDNFLIDKVLREVIHREISDKHVEYRLTERGVVEKMAVETDRRKSPCVSDEELVAITILARRAEKHYGCPQDIEWAIDRHLPVGENVVMLQSRPETVWSRKPKKPIGATTGDPMHSIVSTLLSPMHNKSDGE
ncbi:MAG: PEP/pyruvate-binding domain-containing protein [Acidimicrobiia bacterium]|nr:PEP/pyruvate-binding domain-containing protein [Acidimicrobiia bacterium]